MKQVFRTSFLFLVLAIFLTGTTGVSFYIHECSSSHTREVVPYPEIVNKTSSCCCATDVHGNISSIEQGSLISEPECCKNSHVYLKASFTGFPVFYHFNPEVTRTVLSGDFLNLLHNEKTAEIVSYTPHVDHPPPRAGKILVNFLHQIKIPAPVS